MYWLIVVSILTGQPQVMFSQPMAEVVCDAKADQLNERAQRTGAPRVYGCLPREELPNCNFSGV